MWQTLCECSEDRNQGTPTLVAGRQACSWVTLENRDPSVYGKLRGRLANFLRVLGEGFIEKGNYKQDTEVKKDFVK